MSLPPAPKPKVTCYSEREEAMMRNSQAWRGRWLRPLLIVLARCRIEPNQLTFMSLAAGIAFCPLFASGHWIAALGVLLLHVVLDGLDGPLARFTKTASNRGSFTDTTADQLVVTFTTVTLIHTGHVNVWPGALYLFFYSVVVIFAMVRNALAIPYSWLLRPRFFVYACIPLDIYGWAGSLNVLLWIVTAVLALKMLTGFVQIRRKM